MDVDRAHNPHDELHDSNRKIRKSINYVSNHNAILILILYSDHLHSSICVIATAESHSNNEYQE